MTKESAPFMPWDFRNVGVHAEGKTMQEVDAEAIAWARGLLKRATARTADLAPEDWDALGRIILDRNAEALRLQGLIFKTVQAEGMQTEVDARLEKAAAQQRALTSSAIEGAKGERDFAEKFPDTEIAREAPIRLHALRVLSFLAALAEQEAKLLLSISKSPPAFFSAGIMAHRLELPKTLPLSTGQGSRTLSRALKTYTPAEIAGRVYKESKESKEYEVRILDPEGEVYFHPMLPGMAPDLADPTSIQQAIVRVIPDAYALKILDLCAALALTDPKKSGKFWWHDSKATLAFGLAGRKDSTRGGADNKERQRYAERFERLVSIRVRITRNLGGKAKQVIEGPLLLKYNGPEGVTRSNKTGRRGRPTIEHRYEVNEFLFAEAKRWNTPVPAELFRLPPGPAYKLARYALVRCKMKAKKGAAPEPMDCVAYYSGLTVQDVERALKELEAHPLPGLTLGRGRGRRGLSMTYERPEETGGPRLSGPGGT